jgi:hypothetical protein
MLRQHSSQTQVFEERKEVKPIVVKEETNIIIKELKVKPVKKVTFTEDTIDNEHMNKRKSKSIYFALFSLLYFQKKED